MVTIIIIISASIIAIAACVTAWYAKSIHKLALEIKSKDDDYHQQMNELHKSIIISGLISPNPKKIEIEMLDVEIDSFKKIYKGETSIFEKMGVDLKKMGVEVAKPEKTEKLKSYARSMKELIGNMQKKIAFR